MKRRSSDKSYIEDLPGMVRGVFEKSCDDSWHGCRIRVFAPFPLPLSDESTAFMNTFRTTSHNMVRNTALPTLPSSATVSPKQAQIFQAGQDFERYRTTTLTPSLSANCLRTRTSQTEMEQAVWDALQALFHSEYLLLTEYIECILPMLYAVYLFILFNLPVAAYYPQTAASTPRSWTRMLSTSFVRDSRDRRVRRPACTSHQAVWGLPPLPACVRL